MHILFLIIVCFVKIHLNSEIIVIKTVFLSGVLILENQIALYLCFTPGLIDVLFKKRAFEIQLNRCLRESGHFAQICRAYSLGDLLRWSSRAKTVCMIQVQVDFIKIDKRSIIFLVDRSSVIGPVQTTKFHETNLKH